MHLVHVHRRADGQALIWVVMDFTGSIQPFDIDQVFAPPDTGAHAPKYIGAPQEWLRLFGMGGQELAGCVDGGGSDVVK